MMAYDARDTLDELWAAMHGDSEYADQVRYAICQWAGCDDCIVEQLGEVWVSGPHPRHIPDYEASDLVRHLRRLGLVREVTR